MAALDFPDSPVVGQLYGVSGNSWRWDGTRWASTSGAVGPRGIVARPGTLLNSMFPVAANVVTAITPAVSFTFKAGRTYRVALKIRAIDTNPGGAGYRSVQLLFAGAAYGDYYTYVAAPYMGMYAEFLVSYPVDTTTTVSWAMLAPLASTIHPNGNDSYIEDVTPEGAVSGSPGLFQPAAAYTTLAAAPYPTAGFAYAAFGSGRTSSQSEFTFAADKINLIKGGYYNVSFWESYNVNAMNTGTYVQAFLVAGAAGNVVETLGGMYQSFGSIGGHVVVELAPNQQLGVSHICTGNASLRTGWLSVSRAA